MIVSSRARDSCFRDIYFPYNVESFSMLILRLNHIKFLSLITNYIIYNSTNFYLKLSKID
jgi:hypothetical protein